MPRRELQKLKKKIITQSALLVTGALFGAKSLPLWSNLNTQKILNTFVELRKLGIHRMGV